MRVLKQKDEEKRNYWVVGRISFHPESKLSEPDIKKLRGLILEEDASHPWIDIEARNLRTRSFSINSMSSGKINIKGDTRGSCHFEIHPTVSNLYKAQLYAYEKYLSNIAEKLSQRKIPGIREVGYHLRINTSGRFSST